MNSARAPSVRNGDLRPWKMLLQHLAAIRQRSPIGPSLLATNGASHISHNSAEWIEIQGMDHSAARQTVRKLSARLRDGTRRSRTASCWKTTSCQAPLSKPSLAQSISLSRRNSSDDEHSFMRAFGLFNTAVFKRAGSCNFFAASIRPRYVLSGSLKFLLFLEEQNCCACDQLRRQSRHRLVELKCIQK